MDFAFSYSFGFNHVIFVYVGISPDIVPFLRTENQYGLHINETNSNMENIAWTKIKTRMIKNNFSYIAGRKP